MSDTVQSTTPEPLAVEQTPVPTISQLPIPDPASASGIASQDDIREAVFRYQFEHFWSFIPPPEFYFLSIEGRSRYSDKDPDDAFMSRFNGHQPKVVKVSQVAAEVVMAGVTHKVTGGRGLIFRVTKITWITGSEVMVEGEIYGSGVSRAGHEYRVVLDNGIWTVIEDIGVGMS
ncbi:MAG: hypothetical protein QF898_01815 [SAR202 cluster bacterium]|nr:hypothetical protein [SAR202 cluster bacterium]